MTEFDGTLETAPEGARMTADGRVFVYGEDGSRVYLEVSEAPVKAPEATVEGDDTAPVETKTRTRKPKVEDE